MRRRPSRRPLVRWAALVGSIGVLAATAVPVAATAATRPTDAASMRSASAASLFGAGPWRSPTSEAAKAATALASTDPAGAAAARTIAQYPVATWLGEWTQGAALAKTIDTAVAGAEQSGTTAVFVTYAIPDRDCGGYSAGGFDEPTYAAWVDQIAGRLAGHPAAVVVEPDSLAMLSNTACSDALDEQRYRVLSREVAAFTAAGVPAYLDAGNSNWVQPAVMADRLNRAGVQQARGFFTNVANYYPTAQEQAYAQKVSAATGGSHYVIDTSRNGQGWRGHLVQRHRLRPRHLPEGGVRRQRPRRPALGEDARRERRHLWRRSRCREVVVRLRAGPRRERPARCADPRDGSAWCGRGRRGHGRRRPRPRLDLRRGRPHPAGHRPRDRGREGRRERRRRSSASGRRQRVRGRCHPRVRRGRPHRRGRPPRLCDGGGRRQRRRHRARLPVGPGVPTRPYVTLESATVATAGIAVRGWAFDGDAATSAASVLVGSTGGPSPPCRRRGAERHRLGVGCGGTGTGSSGPCRAAPGSTRCASSHATSASAPTGASTCRTVTVAASAPVGHRDAVSSPSRGRVAVQGWAFDRDGVGKALAVRVIVGGKVVGTLTANDRRADVDRGARRRWVARVRRDRGGAVWCAVGVRDGGGRRARWGPVARVRLGAGALRGLRACGSRRRGRGSAGLGLRVCRRRGRATGAVGLRVRAAGAWVCGPAGPRRRAVGLRVCAGWGRAP